MRSTPAAGRISEAAICRRIILGARWRLRIADLLIEKTRLGSRSTPLRQGLNPHHADGFAQGYGQYVADSEPGMGLIGHLAVDAERALLDQGGTVGAGAHEAGAPQPFVETLPVSVFLFRYGRPPAFGAIRRRPFLTPCGAGHFLRHEVRATVRQHWAAGVFTGAPLLVIAGSSPAMTRGPRGAVLRSLSRPVGIIAATRQGRQTGPAQPGPARG